MSEATSGIDGASGPGYRFAHPGYDSIRATGTRHAMPHPGPC